MKSLNNVLTCGFTRFKERLQGFPNGFRPLGNSVLSPSDVTLKFSIVVAVKVIGTYTGPREPSPKHGPSVKQLVMWECAIGCGGLG